MGRPKAGVAARRLATLNSEVRWEPVEATLDESLAARLLAGADLAVDCADNWEARVALADAAWRAGVPLRTRRRGRVARARWRRSPAAARRASCCVYPEPLQDDAPPPVLGAVAGVVGSLMATEAIRAICGAGTRPTGELLLLDLERGTFDRAAAAPAPKCPLCGGGS